jgi:predicted RNA binding protein YcfA (HicA-like mRNA interferase family)
MKPGNQHVHEEGDTSMAQWSGTKAKDVLTALQRIGWTLKDGKGRTLIPPPTNKAARPYPFHYHDRETVGPPALAKIGRYTGLKPDDL